MVAATHHTFQLHRMNRLSIFLWSLLLLLLVSQFPIFVQQTLTPDTVLYDLQARCLLNGGVLYRDILEPNLPGIVWIHAIVRSVIGRSSPGFLTFDVLIVATIGWLLGGVATSGLECQRTKQTTRAATMLAVMSFYLGTSEWCHCQRDIWMLLPCLLALTIRIKVLRAEHSARSFLLSVLEGTLWAAAFWIKPFVAIPALAVILVSLRFTPSKRAWSMQTLAVLLGGLLTGAVGVGWMIQSGCWSHFVATLTDWNGDYFQAGRSRWTWDRFASHAMRFQPWILLHVVVLFDRVKKMWSRSGVSDDVVSSLLVAFYLGWIAQAFLLQQLFDYIHVPGILLAMTICIHSDFASSASGGRQPSGTTTPQVAGSRINSVCTTLIVFIAFSLFMSPIFRWQRQRLWMPCVQALFGPPLSAESKDQIAQIPFPRWVELQPMLDHVRETGIANQSLMGYNGNLIHLYPELGFQPATRFVYLDVLARSFPGHRDEMIGAVEESRVLYVVSDLREDGWEEDIPDGSWLPTSLIERQSSLCFPYNQTGIFRSGGLCLVPDRSSCCAACA
jgi:hypothetical protein